MVESLQTIHIKQNIRYERQNDIFLKTVISCTGHQEMCKSIKKSGNPSSYEQGRK